MLTGFCQVCSRGKRTINDGLDGFQTSWVQEPSHESASGGFSTQPGERYRGIYRDQLLCWSARTAAGPLRNKKREAAISKIPHRYGL